MSRSVPEQLRELEADVRDLKVLPAAAVRARGRTRGRRKVAAVSVAGVVVATTAGVTVGWPHQGAAPTGIDPAGRAAISCVTALPQDPAEVRIRVFDGGAPAGVADAAAAQLRARTFTVLDRATDVRPEGSAALRYGPAAIGAATLLRAALQGEVTMRFDPDRRDEVIDLTLGPAFTRTATTTELNRNLVAVGEPTAPPQCTTGR
jgi:hypothetical protein